MIEINTQTKISDEREEIFSIDGKAYTIPKEVPGWISLEALEITARQGEALATRWLMIEMLGQEGWDALRTCKALEPHHIRAVQEVIRLKVYGAEEDQGKE